MFSKKNAVIKKIKRKNIILPVDVLAAVSKCSTVFVKFGDLVVVVVLIVA